MKTTDWSEAPAIPGPKSEGGGETAWVVPEKFFDQLGTVLDTVAPLPGEEALYAQFRALLDAAAQDPAVKQALVEAAVETERDVDCAVPRLAAQWTPRRQWLEPVGQQCTVRRRLLQPNRHRQVQHVRQQADRDPVLLYRRRFVRRRARRGASYEVTFAPGQEPPVNGFWSLTLYNEHHFFHPNDIGRYSLGTKNKGLDAQCRRLADALCRREVAGGGQGSELAAGARGAVLALHPRLLGQGADPGRLVATAEDCRGEVEPAGGRSRRIRGGKIMNMTRDDATECAAQRRCSGSPDCWWSPAGAGR